MIKGCSYLSFINTIGETLLVRETSHEKKKNAHLHQLMRQGCALYQKGWRNTTEAARL
jgi:hypothetical protein